MGSHRFVKYNPNDKQKETTDCVVRALCAATGNDWLHVFDRLTEIARELQVMPNNKEAYTSYLEENGFLWVSLKAQKGKKRPTVSYIAKTVSGTAICRCAHHLVTCKGGLYMDNFDSGNMCVYGYWHK